MKYSNFLNTEEKRRRKKWQNRNAIQCATLHKSPIICIDEWEREEKCSKLFECALLLRQQRILHKVGGWAVLKLEIEFIRLSERRRRREHHTRKRERAWMKRRKMQPAKENEKNNWKFLSLLNCLHSHSCPSLLFCSSNASARSAKIWNCIFSVLLDRDEREREEVFLGLKNAESVENSIFNFSTYNKSDFPPLVFLSSLELSCNGDLLWVLRKHKHCKNVIRSILALSHTESCLAFERHRTHHTRAASVNHSSKKIQKICFFPSSSTCCHQWLLPSRYVAATSAHRARYIFFSHNCNQSELLLWRKHKKKVENIFT